MEVCLPEFSDQTGAKIIPFGVVHTLHGLNKGVTLSNGYAIPLSLHVLGSISKTFTSVVIVLEAENNS